MKKLAALVVALLAAYAARDALLRSAASVGVTPLAKLSLRVGADPYAKDGDGKNAFQLSADHPETLDALADAVVARARAEHEATRTPEPRSTPPPAQHPPLARPTPSLYQTPAQFDPTMRDNLRAIDSWNQTPVPAPTAYPRVNPVPRRR